MLRTSAVVTSPARHLWRRYPLTSALTALMVVTLVLVPKGGIKVFNYPLTWGYMLIAFSLPVLTVIRFFGVPLRFRRNTLLAIGSLIPFCVLFIYSYFANNTADMGGFVSDIVSLFVMPFAFLLVYPAFYKRMNGKLIADLLRFSMFGAAVFGLGLFVSYPLTGKLFEIPYVTVNADDYGQLEYTKHIARGAFLKLISTYNNGNLYGAATLILLPLYSFLEPKVWRRNVIRLALVLTLSRTVWIGVLLEQTLGFAPIVLSGIRTFPRVAVGKAAKRLLFIGFTAVIIFGGFSLITSDLSFLLDSSLGGRADFIRLSVANITWLPGTPIIGFPEVVYAAGLYIYGIFGFFAVILIFVFPVILVVAGGRESHSPVQVAAFRGLVLYMVIAGIDGALNLIPVMAFYWFTYMIFIEGWPGGYLPPQEVAAVPRFLSVPAPIAADTL